MNSTETAERIASTVAGATAVVSGLRRSGNARTVGIIAGAGLLAYGIVGRSRIRRSIQNDGREEAIQRVITVGKPRREVYRKWRDPLVMSRVFADVIQVERRGDRKLRFRASLPGGRSMKWTSQLVEEKPESSLRWRTEPDADFPHEMFVQFRSAEPAVWGTEVTLGFLPTSSSLMQTIIGSTSIVGNTVLNKILRRFKALVETGEIPTLEANPAGRERTLAAA